MPARDNSPLAVLSELQKTSPVTARIIYIALGVVFFGSTASMYAIAPEQVPRVAISIAFAAVILLIAGNFYGLISTVLAWFATMAAIVWTSAFMLQTLSGDAVLPLRAGCFFHPWQIGCPAEAPSKKRYVGTREGQNDVPVPAPEVGPNKVYVQFAGSIVRNDLVENVSKLVEAGWNVQGANRGGERTSAAYRLNEVRFFRKEDEALANQLAINFADEVSWTDKLKTVNLSDAGYSTPKGYLEVWTSKP